MHVIWYTAMSMDGRIASSSNSLDFLSTIQSGETENEGESFATFLSTIDAVVVGGTTMRWLLDGGHGWPHDDLPTWLVSHDKGLLDRIGSTRATLKLCEGDIAAVFREIGAQGDQRVWLCGGGDIAGQTLAADYIDEVVVTIAPTALGSGPMLFDAPDLPQRDFQPAQARISGSSVCITWLRNKNIIPL